MNRISPLFPAAAPSPEPPSFSHRLATLTARLRTALAARLPALRRFRQRLLLLQGWARFWLGYRLRGLGKGLPGVHYIGGSDTFPPPLSGPEEAALLAGLGGENDWEVKTVLIEHNLRLVVYIARRFENTGINMEDLISIGAIGLIKAINTFDPQKKIKLATYASRCIENEILMHLRRTSKTRSEVSIDEPLNVDWEGNELLLSDILGTDSDIVSRELEDEVNRELLYKALEKLDGREKQIVELRFGIGRPGGAEKTQKEVAELLGISQSYISRLEKKIILRLRKEISRMV